MQPQSLFEQTKDHFSNLYEEQENISLSYIVLEEIFELSKTDIIINQSFTPSSIQLNRYINTLKRSKNYEPIQHILGYADFYGRRFKVSPDTLIPRQETELLIQIIKNYQPWNKPVIVDIGTGSGCIACSLALEIPSANVTAYDISEAALKLAESNADNLNTSITFGKKDILKDNLESQSFDVIVSNPPYVMEQERSVMKSNVLNFEPELALFVSDTDPLLFYRAISIQATKALKKGGLLFFEINEQFGQETLNLMYDLGFQNGQIHNDLNGKQRFTSAVWP